MLNVKTESRMDISIIIVNWNTERLLIDCIRSIYETVENISYEIWVVDNASTDSSVAAVKQNYPDVKIIQNSKNLGFAAANNFALEEMLGRYALLLNTDSILTSGAVEDLFNFMEKNQNAGMACGQLLNLDGSKQNSIASFPSRLSLLCNESLLQIVFPARFPGKRNEYKKPVEIDSCIGACLMARKKAVDEIGPFDKNYFFFFEETDWAYRMKQAGWKIFLVPSAKIFHIQGQTVGHDIASRIMFYRSRYIYFNKWYKNSYSPIRCIIFARLLVNTTVNLAGAIATLGMHSGIRKRLSVYTGLIWWHLAGCPEDR